MIQQRPYPVRHKRGYIIPWLTALLPGRVTRLCCLVACFGLPASAHPADADPWTPVRQEAGIRIDVRTVEGSDILRVRTETRIQASVQRIRTLIDDAAHRKNWVPYLEESRVLARLSDTEHLEYSLFSAPWPASDRDFVYRIRQLQRSDGSRVFAMASEPSSLMPVDDSRVRAELMESVYTLTPVDENETRVELVFHADPKGWLPTWIINIIQRVLPYMMLKNLRQQATADHPHPDGNTH